MRPLACLFGILAFLLAGSSAQANSVTVRGEAALGSPGFRLAVILDDPDTMARNDAWVGIGPDRGMAEESHVVGHFVIDLGGLRMAPSRPENPRHLCFLGLSETADWQTARVILFLERGPDRSWLIGARVWDDALASYVAVGPSLLIENRATVSRSPSVPAEPGPPPEAIRVDFEWQAASAPGAQDGLLRLYRTVAQGTELLAESTALTNGSQKLNFLRVGVVNAAHQARGTFGTLSLDDVSLSRTFGTPAPDVD
jgi:hypothetical protein